MTQVQPICSSTVGLCFLGVATGLRPAEAILAIGFAAGASLAIDVTKRNIPVSKKEFYVLVLLSMVFAAFASSAVHSHFKLDPAQGAVIASLLGYLSPFLFFELSTWMPSVVKDGLRLLKIALRKILIKLMKRGNKK